MLVDAGGVPLVTIITAANRHDVTQLEPLVDAIPPVAGRVGRPLRRPAAVVADQAYCCRERRRRLRRRGIRPLIAKRGRKHGSGLGKKRWVVERTISWLHQFRRLRTRYDRRCDIHDGFVNLAEALICFRLLGT